MISLCFSGILVPQNACSLWEDIWYFLDGKFLGNSQVNNGVFPFGRLISCLEQFCASTSISQKCMLIHHNDNLVVLITITNNNVYIYIWLYMCVCVCVCIHVWYTYIYTYMLPVQYICCTHQNLELSASVFQFPDLTASQTPSFPPTTTTSQNWCHPKMWHQLQLFWKIRF